MADPLAGAADDREPGEHSGAAEKAVLRIDNHIVVTGSRDPLGRDGMVLGHLMTDRALPRTHPGGECRLAGVGHGSRLRSERSEPGPAGRPYPEARAAAWRLGRALMP
jgi:hypothetical protein